MDSLHESGCETDRSEGEVAVTLESKVMQHARSGLPCIREKALRQLAARLASSTAWHGECLEWTGSKAGAGYGYISIRHDKGRTNFYVHRLVCEAITGRIGKIAMHSCDNPACCNPDHLSWGTRSDNTQDMVRKNRHGIQMRAGVRHSLTWQQAQAIREANGTIRSIAKQFGTNHAKVWRIRAGLAYKTEPQ